MKPVQNKFLIWQIQTNKNKKNQGNKKEEKKLTVREGEASKRLNQYFSTVSWLCVLFFCIGEREREVKLDEYAGV